MLHSECVRESVTIRCNGYHALIVNTFIPDHWRTKTFLATVDTLIALQWNVTTDNLLFELLSNLSKNKVIDNCPTTSCNPKCLITPRLSISDFRVANSATASPWRQVRQQPRSIEMALRLGINVLQLGPSHSISHQYVRSNQQKYENNNYNNKCKTQTRISVNKEDNYGWSTDGQTVSRRFRLKETTLYHKLGIGTLNLIPMFTRPIGTMQSTFSFNALFVWHPHGRQNATVGTSVRTTNDKYVLLSPSFTGSSLGPGRSSRPQTCSYRSSENSPNSEVHNTPSADGMSNILAEKHLCLLVKLLTALLPVPATPIRRNKSAATPGLRSGLSQSHTFTSGFTIAKPPKLEETKLTNLCTNGQNYENSNEVKQLNPMALAFSEKYGDWSSPYLPREQMMNDHEDLNKTSNTASHDLALSSTSKLKHDYDEWKLVQVPRLRLIEVPSAETERLSNTSDAQRLSLNEPLLHSKKDIEDSISPGIGKISKSTSCPDGFKCDIPGQAALNNPTSPKRPSTMWPDLSSAAFSATVLLAIPEVGEADYYAESPQCLTVADLRAMGLCGESDESDESEDSEGDIDHENSLRDHRNNCSLTECAVDAEGCGKIAGRETTGGTCLSQHAFNNLISKFDSINLIESTGPKTELSPERVNPLC